MEHFCIASYWSKQIISRFTYMIQESKREQAVKDHVTLQLIFSSAMLGAPEWSISHYSYYIPFMILFHIYPSLILTIASIKEN